MNETQRGDEIFSSEPSPGLEPLEEDNLKSFEKLSGRTWAQYVQSTLLLLSCLCSLAFAVAGFLLLVFIFFSRNYAPPLSHLTRELYFDYSDSTAVATASFLDTSLNKGSTKPPRVFPPGQKLKVWLELEAAEAHGNVNTDIFQVLAQLLTADGKAAATASRPCLVTYWSPTLRYIRSLASLPLVLAGLRREHEILQVPLFSGYADQFSKPFTEFRAVLRASHKDGRLPHLYSAKVHVSLALGLFRRMIYLMRPGTWTMLLLSLTALCGMAGGSMTAAILYFFWLSAGQKPSAPTHSPPRSDAGNDKAYVTQEEVHRSSFDSTEPMPRTKATSKGTARTKDRGSSQRQPVELVLKDTLPTTPKGLLHRGPLKQLEAG